MLAVFAVFAVVAVVAPATADGAARRGSANVTADFFTKKTPPLAGGQVELATISAMPKAVTGGDVLVAVRGLRDGDVVSLARNGKDVSGALGSPVGNERRALVEGLKKGSNKLVAKVRRGKRHRRVALQVENHPITGPVVSGPHQKPFYCETERSGLGKATDDDCSIKTRVQWYYRSAIDLGYHELSNPYSPYPADTARTRTSKGKVVPFVVRLETATINRGIGRIAVLDDPRARGKDDSQRTNWSGRITYAFGESCGVGYRQGSSQPSNVLGGVPREINADTLFANIYGLTERLGKGDLVAHSTLTTFGVYCNPLVSAETLMLMKEHVRERYGPIERTVGVGGSGGALQQYNAVNNAPGLLDAAIPVASFTDVVSTAMSVVDCGLLTDYWGRTGRNWTDSQKAAVGGHVSADICASWRSTFLSRLDPARGCDGAVPRAVRYDREKNPKGVRCTLQDATINIWGRDGKTGAARRPYDNVGVQYGLLALNAGSITPEQFIDLNREIGGYDLDARRQAERNSMTTRTAERAYRLGGVIGRGALHRAPVIDLATYLDLIPVADIHDVVRPFEVRARLRRRGLEANQSIWRGVSLPSDAQPVIDSWLDALDRTGDRGDAAAVARAKPANAGDRCIVAAGASLDTPDALTLPGGLLVQLFPGLFPGVSVPLQVNLPERQDKDVGFCQNIAPAKAGTRIVAGGPLSDDVIKCRLKPVDMGDYKVGFSAAEQAELRRIFPSGVCDYSKPGVGDVKRSMLFASLGGERLERPHELRWTAARSTGPYFRSR